MALNVCNKPDDVVYPPGTALPEVLAVLAKFVPDANDDDDDINLCSGKPLRAASDLPKGIETC
jgi:hypothetical protein